MTNNISKIRALAEANHFQPKVIFTNRISAALTALASLLLISGCSTSPNRVAEPTIQIKPSSQTDKIKANYLIDGKPILYGQFNHLDSEILPFETTREGLLTQIMAFRGAYNKKGTELLVELDGANNGQFFGILLSAAGVALSNNSVRNTGAGVAGLSTLWSSHYNIAIQAKNYTTATEALDCIYRAIDEVPQSFFDELYDTSSGQLKISKEAIRSAPVDQNSSNLAAALEAYDSLSSIFRNANSQIYGVIKSLHKNQQALIVSSASLSDVTNAIKNAASSAGTAEKNAQALLLASQTATPGEKVTSNPVIYEFPDNKSSATKRQGGNPRDKAKVHPLNILSATPLATIKMAISLPSAMSTCTTVATGSQKE